VRNRDLFSDRDPLVATLPAITEWCSHSTTAGTGDYYTCSISGFLSGTKGVAADPCQGGQILSAPGQQPKDQGEPALSADPGISADDFGRF